MRPLQFILPLTIFAGIASAQKATTPATDLGARADWIATQKKNNPKGFADRYGLIDLADGVDEKESRAIAALFFYSTGFQCGYVSAPKKIGDRWKCETSVGPLATPVNPIWVDAKTGTVWQDGGDRIDDVAALLRTTAKK